MIYNLCDNAIKYNYENGKVDVNVKTFSDQVVLTVADNGFGIPRSTKAACLNAFIELTSPIQGKPVELVWAFLL